MKTSYSSTKINFRNDFIMFILSDYDELNDELGFFFNENNTVDYPEFILNIKTNGFNEDSALIIQNVHIIDDVFSKLEQRGILDFINSFTYCYPDESFKSFQINLIDVDLLNSFEIFLKLKKKFPYIFISYYKYYIQYHIYYYFKSYLDNFKNNIENEIIIIENLNVKPDYKLNLKNRHLDKYLNSVSNFPIINGFYDDSGFFLSLEETLLNYLLYFENKTISYSSNFDLLPESYSYLEYNFILKKFYPDSLIKENIDLQDEFDLLNEDGLNTFLKEKGFESNEIHIIINGIAGNKFNSLNIRNINIATQVDFFRFCWLFYIFDYFESDGHKFDSFRTFDKIYSFQTTYDERIKIDTLKQFKKYYDFLNRNAVINQKHNPFLHKEKEKIFEKIESELNIRKEKLKSVK